MNVIGLVLLVASKEVWTFALGIIFLGFAKGCVEPLGLIFIAENFATSLQKNAVGITELSWGVSALGIPLLGFLLDISWKLPFYIFGGGLVVIQIPLYYMTANLEQKMKRAGRSFLGASVQIFEVYGPATTLNS